jgi:hypothetical protein
MAGGTPAVELSAVSTKVQPAPTAEELRPPARTSGTPKPQTEGPEPRARCESPRRATSQKKRGREGPQHRTNTPNEEAAPTREKMGRSKWKWGLLHRPPTDKHQGNLGAAPAVRCGGGALRQRPCFVCAGFVFRGCISS